MKRLESPRALISKYSPALSLSLYWLFLHRQILTQIIRLKIREGNRRGKKKKKREREEKKKKKEKYLFVQRVTKFAGWLRFPRGRQ